MQIGSDIGDGLNYFPKLIPIVVVIEFMVFGRNQYITIPYTSVRSLSTLQQCLLQNILINAWYFKFRVQANLDQAKEDVDDDMFSKTSSKISGMIAHTWV